MAVVVTRRDQDRALEKLAPPYLGGYRNKTARVQWALDRFLEATKPHEKNGKSPRVNSTTAATN